MNEPDNDFVFNIDMDTTEARKQLKLLNVESLNLGSSVKTAFESIAIKGKDVQSVFKNLVLSLSRRAFSQAIGPVSSLFDNAFSGAGGAIGNIFGFAKGGAFGSGLGGGGGVLNSPVAFPLGNAGGSMGVAGEAGPEAILPLTRGANGELGVRSSGGSITVNVNISTPDIESFRRSEGEIAASLQRIVSRGNRNL